MFIKYKYKHKNRKNKNTKNKIEEFFTIPFEKHSELKSKKFTIDDIFDILNDSKLSTDEKYQYLKYPRILLTQKFSNKSDEILLLNMIQLIESIMYFRDLNIGAATFLVLQSLSGNKKLELDNKVFDLEIEHDK